MEDLSRMTCLRTLAAALCLLLFSPALHAGVPTYAERLGWDPGARVVMFHNDDAGMAREANEGTIRSLEEGVVTSFSIMMPCGWVPEIAAYTRENPDVCAGLHLTLNSEWEPYRWRPVAGEAVPSLIDPDGYLWSSTAQVAEHADPDEVERELRAQIGLARDLGIPISHMDTHMGALFGTPELLERYIRVGVSEDIPVMMPAGHMTHVRREQEDAMDLFEPHIGEIAERIWDAGLPLIDDIHTDNYGWDPDGVVEGFSEMLRELEPGITVVIVHASASTPAFREYGDRRGIREADLEAMIDPRLAEVITEEGIELTTWRELHERRRALSE